MPQSSSFSIQFSPFFFSFLPPVRTASLPCGRSTSCCQSFLPSVSIFLKSILPLFNPSSNVLSLLFSLFFFLVFLFFALLRVDESGRQQIIPKIGNNGEAVKTQTTPGERSARRLSVLRRQPRSSSFFDSFNIK